MIIYDYILKCVSIMSDLRDALFVGLHGRTLAHLVAQIVTNFTNLLFDLVHSYIVPFLRIVSTLPEPTISSPPPPTKPEDKK